MLYRVIQVVCVLGGLVAAALLITTGSVLLSTWTDYGFRNCSGCDEARTSFLLVALKALLTFAIPITLCALGFWWAGKTRRMELRSTAS